MKCIECGKKIDDNSTVCKYCNAEIISPVILSEKSVEKVKEFQKNEKKRLRELKKIEEAKRLEERKKKLKTNDIPFYERKEYKRACFISELLAGILVLILPYLTWHAIYLKDKTGTIKMKYSLMTLCREKNVLAIICLIVLIFIGIWMIYIALVDNFKIIPKIKFFGEYKLIPRVTVMAVFLIVLIILWNSKAYGNKYEEYKGLEYGFQSMVILYKSISGSSEGMKCTLKSGSAAYIWVLSMLTYVFSQCFKFVMDTLNEDSDKDKEEMKV